MSEYFTLGSNHIVAEVEIQPGGISGSGRSEHPFLVFHLKLALHCPKSQGLAVDFRELRCRLSPFDSTYIAESRPAWINVRLESDNNVPNYSAYLEVPLDQVRLALLNRLRKGGDVKFRLDLELKADELIEVGRPGMPPNASVWGLKARANMLARLQTIIPRSVWVEQVLPGTGFGRAHIIELPAIPIESCAGIQGSFDALQQAQKLESQGFYDEAVGKCRIALEPFFEMVAKVDGSGATTKVPMLKNSWEKRLGKVTYDWLNASFVILKQATNQPHHLSSSNYGQLEAQMLLIVTTALLAYAVKMQPEGTA